MRESLTIEIHPSINPLSEDMWNRHFPHQLDPQKLKSLLIDDPHGAAEFLSVVVNYLNKPVVLVPLILHKSSPQTISEKVKTFLSQTGRWARISFFDNEGDSSHFEDAYVFTSFDVEPGSNLHTEALKMASTAFNVLSANMAVAPMRDKLVNQFRQTQATESHAERLA